MTDFCHCEVCGYPKAGIFDRCGLKVCADCSTKERWCPTVTLYPTRVQAWRDVDEAESKMIPYF